MDDNKHFDDEVHWCLPKDYKPTEDTSPRYIVSEIQLRKLFGYFFCAPLLDFNRDFIQEFIEKEELKLVSPNGESGELNETIR